MWAAAWGSWAAQQDSLRVTQEKALLFLTLWPSSFLKKKLNFSVSTLLPVSLYLIFLWALKQLHTASASVPNQGRSFSAQQGLLLTCDIQWNACSDVVSWVSSPVLLNLLWSCLAGRPFPCMKAVDVWWNLRFILFPEMWLDKLSIFKYIFFFFFLLVNNLRAFYDFLNSVLICQFQDAPSINIEVPVVLSFVVYLVQLMLHAN